MRIPSSQISQLPQTLKAIPAARVKQMQARLAEVKQRYLLYPFNTALSLLRLRVRTLLNETG